MKKIVGSAQRKMNRSLLQHGSILCGKKHTEIVNYLNLPEEVLETLKREIRDTTTDIESIAGQKVDYDFLSEAIKSGFEEHFKIHFESSSVIRKNDLTIQD